MSQWIRVEDQLPDRMLLVLVRVKSKSKYSYDQTMIMGRNENGIWGTAENKQLFYDAYITHWMPLPKPPESPL